MNSTEELQIKVENGVKELVIRHGEALQLKEPVKVAITGNIDALGRYLTKRKDELKEVNCFIEITRDENKMTLIVDEHSAYSDKITGALEISKEVKMFSLNTGEQYTSFELADFIRMNRSYFQKPDEATRLVMALRSFKAKVNQEIESSDDKRGNRDIVRRQAVESNLPESFKIEIPIFKGLKKCVVEVEVDIDADNLNCSLVSPMANELMQTLTDDLINDEIKIIENLMPGLLIVEC